MEFDFDVIIRQIAISAVPILFAVVIHELSHGYVAFKLGDPTAKMLGRLTLNPLSHIDIVGTIILPLSLYVMTSGQFVFGYAKPVPINTRNFANPSRDMALCAAAGPVSNLIIATISMILLKYIFIPSATLISDDLFEQTLKPIALMLKTSVFVNVILAVFNMLPVPPLDGGRVLAGILPYRYSSFFDKIEPFGFIIVLILIITGLTSYFVYPIVKLILGILELL
ncbi:MAG: site-2 protease family protein [Thermodesulfovibrionales bacterium]